MSEAEREAIPTGPGVASRVGITPILHWPGVSTPCEFGPISAVFEPRRAALTRVMSCCGTRSVTQTTTSSSASIASISAAAAAWAGTITSEALAPVAALQSATLSNIGRSRCRVPPLPGRTPPT